MAATSNGLGRNQTHNTQSLEESSTNPRHPNTGVTSAASLSLLLGKALRLAIAAIFALQSTVAPLITSPGFMAGASVAAVMSLAAPRKAQGGRAALMRQIAAERQAKAAESKKCDITEAPQLQRKVQGQTQREEFGGEASGSHQGPEGQHYGPSLTTPTWAKTPRDLQAQADSLIFLKKYSPYDIVHASNLNLSPAKLRSHGGPRAYSSDVSITVTPLPRLLLLEGARTLGDIVALRQHHETYLEQGVVPTDWLEGKDLTSSHYTQVTLTDWSLFFSPDEDLFAASNLPEGDSSMNNWLFCQSPEGLHLRYINPRTFERYGHPISRHTNHQDTGKDLWNRASLALLITHDGNVETEYIDTNAATNPSSRKNELASSSYDLRGELWAGVDRLALKIPGTLTIHPTTFLDADHLKIESHAVYNWGDIGRMEDCIRDRENSEHQTLQVFTRSLCNMGALRAHTITLETSYLLNNAGKIQCAGILSSYGHELLNLGGDISGAMGTYITVGDRLNNQGGILGAGGVTQLNFVRGDAYVLEESEERAGPSNTSVGPSSLQEEVINGRYDLAGDEVKLVLLGDDTDFFLPLKQLVAHDVLRITAANPSTRLLAPSLHLHTPRAVLNVADFLLPDQLHCDNLTVTRRPSEDFTLTHPFNTLGRLTLAQLGIGGELSKVREVMIERYGDLQWGVPEGSTDMLPDITHTFRLLASIQPQGGFQVLAPQARVQVGQHNVEAELDGTKEYPGVEVVLPDASLQAYVHTFDIENGSLVANDGAIHAPGGTLIGRLIRDPTRDVFATFYCHANVQGCYSLHSDHENFRHTFLGHEIGHTVFDGYHLLRLPVAIANGASFLTRDELVLDGLLDLRGFICAKRININSRAKSSALPGVLEADTVLFQGGGSLVLGRYTSEVFHNYWTEGCYKIPSHVVAYRRLDGHYKIRNDNQKLKFLNSDPSSLLVHDILELDSEFSILNEASNLYAARLSPGANIEKKDFTSSLYQEIRGDSPVTREHLFRPPSAILGKYSRIHFYPCMPGRGFLTPRNYINFNAGGPYALAFLEQTQNFKDARQVFSANQSSSEGILHEGSGHFEGNISTPTALFLVDRGDSLVLGTQNPYYVPRPDAKRSLMMGGFNLYTTTWNDSLLEKIRQAQLAQGGIGPFSSLPAFLFKAQERFWRDDQSDQAFYQDLRDHLWVKHLDGRFGLISDGSEGPDSHTGGHKPLVLGLSPALLLERVQAQCQEALNRGYIYDNRAIDLDQVRDLHLNTTRFIHNQGLEPESLAQALVSPKGMQGIPEPSDPILYYESMEDEEGVSVAQPVLYIPNALLDDARAAAGSLQRINAIGILDKDASLEEALAALEAQPTAIRMLEGFFAHNPMITGALRQRALMGSRTPSSWDEDLAKDPREAPWEEASEEIWEAHWEEDIYPNNGESSSAGRRWDKSWDKQSVPSLYEVDFGHEADTLPSPLSPIFTDQDTALSSLSTTLDLRNPASSVVSSAVSQELQKAQEELGTISLHGTFRTNRMAVVAPNHVHSTARITGDDVLIASTEGYAHAESVIERRGNRENYQDVVSFRAGIDTSGDQVFMGQGGIMLQGVAHSAGGGIALHGGGDSVVTSQQLYGRYVYEDHGKRHHTTDVHTTVTQSGSSFQSGGEFSLTSSRGDAFLAATSVKAREARIRGQSALLPQLHDQHHSHRHTTRKGGFFRKGGSETTVTHTITSVSNQFDVSDLTVEATQGSITATNLRNTGTTNLLNPQGPVSLALGTNTYLGQRQRATNSIWWNSAESHEESHLTHSSFGLEGPIRIVSASTYLQLKGEDPRNQAILDRLTLEITQPDALSETQAGTQAETQEPLLDADTRSRSIAYVHDQHHHESHHIESAGVATRALIAIAVSVATGGIATAPTTMLGAAGQAFGTSLATSALSNSLGTGPTLGKDDFKAAFTAAVSAGITHGVMDQLAPQSTGPQAGPNPGSGSSAGSSGGVLTGTSAGASSSASASASSSSSSSATSNIRALPSTQFVQVETSLLQQVGEHLISNTPRDLVRAAAKTVAQATIEGIPVSEALVSNLRDHFAASVGAALSHGIGIERHLGNLSGPGGELIHKLAHASVGALTAALAGQDIPSGALGAVVGELVGEALVELAPDHLIKAVSEAAAVIAAGALDLDISTAQRSARIAVEENALALVAGGVAGVLESAAVAAEITALTILIGTTYDKIAELYDKGYFETLHLPLSVLRAFWYKLQPFTGDIPPHVLARDIFTLAEWSRVRTDHTGVPPPPPHLGYIDLEGVAGDLPARPTTESFPIDGPIPLVLITDVEELRARLGEIGRPEGFTPLTRSKEDGLLWTPILTDEERRRGLILTSDQAWQGPSHRSGADQGSSSGPTSERKQGVDKAESPVWKGLKPCKGDVKENGKAGKKKKYFQWDYTHQEIEVYNHKKIHEGAIDSVSGEKIKDPVPGRKLKF